METLNFLMDQKTLKKTARLARLKLSKEEEKAFAGELSAVLEYFNQISSLDTKGVRPLVYPLEGLVPPPAFREDQVLETQNRKQLLNLAPESLGNEYKVPPVVESVF